MHFDFQVEIKATLPEKPSNSTYQKTKIPASAKIQIYALVEFTSFGLCKTFIK